MFNYLERDSVESININSVSVDSGYSFDLDASPPSFASLPGPRLLGVLARPCRLPLCEGARDDDPLSFSDPLSNEEVSSRLVNASTKTTFEVDLAKRTCRGLTLISELTEVDAELMLFA